MKIVPNAVSRTFGRQILLTQKHSPELLFAVGIAGVVTSTVMACKATLRVEEVLDENLKNLQLIDETSNVVDKDTYSEMDAKRDKALVYVKSTGTLIKLYGPALAVGAVSIGCLAGSHNILSRRNVALTAAYAAVEKGFDEYRARVREEFGDEKDQELRYGKVTSQITKEGKNGPKTVEVVHADPNGVSVYAKFFDEASRQWSPQPEYNRIFLTAQQNYANDLLRSRGHVFLNEVYDMLGLERTKAGAVVGWILSKNGDNFVDFGFLDGSRERIRDFVNGHEGSILLDFNVDGVIYDKI